MSDSLLDRLANTIGERRGGRQVGGIKASSFLLAYHTALSSDPRVAVVLPPIHVQSDKLLVIITVWQHGKARTDDHF